MKSIIFVSAVLVSLGSSVAHAAAAKNSNETRTQVLKWTGTGTSVGALVTGRSSRINYRFLGVLHDQKIFDEEAFRGRHGDQTVSKTHWSKRIDQDVSRRVKDARAIHKNDFRTINRNGGMEKLRASQPDLANTIKGRYVYNHSDKELTILAKSWKRNRIASRVLGAGSIALLASILYFESKEPVDSSLSDRKTKQLLKINDEFADAARTSKAGNTF